MERDERDQVLIRSEERYIKYLERNNVTLYEDNVYLRFLLVIQSILLFIALIYTFYLQAPNFY